MLDGNTAIVTGGTNGIGREIALTYADHGADVVVADREREPRHAEEPTHRRVRSRGVRGEFVETDVSDPDNVATLFETVEASFDSLDVLVNNAGITLMDDEARALEVDDWNLIVGVNLTGTFLCCKHALPSLLERDGGSIVNMSSVAGLRAGHGRSAYSASKAGIANLTRAIALDYGPDGIRANSIHPAPIETEGLKLLREEGASPRLEETVDGVPMGRIGTPEDVAGAALFLASDLASYVNGHSLVVDGGLTAKYY